MKTRNLFFGLVALLLGVGTSFASLVKPLSVNAYALTKLTDSQQEEWQCRQIGECDGGSGGICHILVPSTSAGANEDIIARPMNDCADGTLPHSTSQPFQGEIEFYDVQ